MSDLRQKSIDAVIWNLFERYGIQVVNLIMGVILARLLTPSDYGLIGMITVFFALAMVFVNSGFGAAYIQKKNATETDASTIFYFNVFVSLFFYTVLWFVSPIIADFYEQHELVNLIRVAAVVLIINSFGMMQINKLTKEVDFRKKTVISLSSTILSGTIGIIAALNNFGVWSLVLQQITRSLINTIGLWLFYKWRPLIIFSISSLKELFSFSSWILLSSLVVTFFDNIYILTIGKLYPVSELGLYTKSKGYQRMVSQQPSSAISLVSFPVFSKLQDDKVALKNSIKKFMTHTLFFIAPISIICIIVAHPLILLVLTKKWVNMVPYFQLLLVAGLLYPIHQFNVQLLTAKGMTRINFNLNILKNILRLINILIMYKYGVIFIIYGEIIVSVLSLFINGYFTKKLINYNMFEQLRDLSMTFIISLVVFIIGFSINEILSNDYLKILLGVIIPGTCYLFFQYMLNRSLFNSNLFIIKQKFSLRK